MRCRRATIAAGCAAVLTLAACSDPGAPEATPTPGATSSAPVTTAPPATSSPPGSAPSDPVPEPTSAPTPDDTATSTAPPQGEPEPDTITFDQGVSAGHPAAVEAGMQVLAADGSAVDAAIASAFAMAVAEPFTSGPGGGGAAVLVGPGVQPAAYDYREVVAEDGVIPASETGVPGFVAGMARLHEEHGVLPWDQVLQPAIELAQDGVPVSGFLADELLSPAGLAATAGYAAFEGPQGGPRQEGELLVQPELAQSLQVLADDGPGAFYDGALTPALTDVDGLDAESLAAYEVQEGEPARGPVGDGELLTSAPPLVGAALVQQLQVAEALGVGDTEPGSADHVDAVLAGWRVAERSATTVIGDPDFVEVPVEELTDPERNADIAEQFTAGTWPGAVGPPPDAGPPTSTTHISVVDDTGLTVSMTNTILSFWGSGAQVGGFYLNDTLGRFSVGAGGEANEPLPGRRPTSWIAGGLVLDDQERPVLAIGSPGGRRIPNILTATLTRYLLQGQGLETSVLAGRFHLEDGVIITEPLEAGAVDELREGGQAVEQVPSSDVAFGSVQVLAIDPETGEVAGVTDPRRAGTYEVAPVE